MAFMLRQTAHRVLNAAEKLHNKVRPIYDAARPVLRHAGLDTSIPDKALSTYDGIRRAIHK